MLNRALPDIDEQDFASLVSNGIHEARDLEFKRDLPGGADTEIKEFLADVTSLANAQGGDLLLGVEERDGVASAIAGIDTTNLDATMLRLENMVRDGVEPRLTVRMRSVPLANGRFALVMRIPASLAAPHRIRFKNNGRFWNRNSRGKYEMDVHELRHAFTQSEEMPKRLREFHEDAVNATQHSIIPFGIDAAPYAIISIIPLGLLRENRDLALTPENTILPVKSQNALQLPILEGMLWHAPVNESNRVRSYALTHRSGRIDAAWTFGKWETLDDGKSTTLVWASQFEEGAWEMVSNGATRLRSYGIDGPWVVMTTVDYIENSMMVNRNNTLSRPSWRKRARLPELILERERVESLLPIFKALWLLFGLNRPDQVPK